MTEHQLYQANINNLISLWHCMGSNSTSIAEHTTLYQSDLWPHRYWFDNELVSAPSVMKGLIDKLDNRFVLPVSQRDGEDCSERETLLLDQGFTVSFEQKMMSMQLNTAPDYTLSDDVDIQCVNHAKEITLWIEIASQAFGYFIEPSVIHALFTQPNVALLIAFKEGQALGTAMVYVTGKIVGVHMVGVTQTARGQGIAREIMCSIINKHRNSQVTHITLQASAAGEPLYDRLNFVPQGVIRNYIRVTKN